MDVTSATASVTMTTNPLIGRYISDLKATLDLLSTAEIDTVIDLLHAARMSKHTIFIVGNGGSASTASHFMCDLAKNTQRPDMPHFRVVALTDNMASFSAYANDEGYDQVFARQLEVLIRPNDIVIAISASGNSPNVLNAIELANQSEARTIGFTGFDGGKLRQIAQNSIHVPSNCIEQVEDIHLMLEHLICTALKQPA
ncbi:MAG: SIS domain-containing protein [Anaerolineae bacterium]|nr:SIS domain-containing protein [Anaerolineae bacterium]MCO5186907.1 SIS domain-containing protein [Anaerolineae bacterium]MCO5192608.1 SIS domain-containing protein [Anaerolineae bacterium]MCO5199168.1 SIS domain-containing protein [Anaerolineae bacterium]MCO5203660.1 SIS domain-containing protein [Anaerolineae bacterium]